MCGCKACAGSSSFHRQAWGCSRGLPGLPQGWSDRDLDRYTASGIHRSYLDEGQSLVDGGWGFIIINNTLHYNPYGKAPTHNHAMVM
jgi:hypothetical protein